MVLTFFTSVTDTEKMLEILDHKIIAKRYFEMWFWIDFVSIFPFDEFGKAILATEAAASPDGGSTNGSVLLRGFKLSKIGRMIRLMRLVKVFKIMKNS
jgi:hypothetical protein